MGKGKEMTDNKHNSTAQHGTALCGAVFSQKQSLVFCVDWVGGFDHHQGYNSVINSNIEGILCIDIQRIYINNMLMVDIGNVRVRRN
jgi:hypothetical protein